MPDTYKIVRFYIGENRRKSTVARGLTLEEVQKHCQDPESSWKTCTKAEGKRRTKKYGPWFDGYYKE